MNLRTDILGKVSRIVIKLGTGLLTDAQNHLSLARIERVVAQIAALHQQKKWIIAVSSVASLTARSVSASPGTWQFVPSREIRSCGVPAWAA